MSKSKSGGLPRDTLFRRTEVQEEEAQEVEETTEKAAPQKKASIRPSRKRQVDKSQSKQRDSEILPVDSGAAEKQRTTEISRQTYYVPSELHKQLRLLALQQERNVSDFVLEGIEWVLKKYDK